MWRNLAFAAAALAMSFPAGAETLAYECRISQRTSGGETKTYDDAERAQPGLRERFAFNVAAGRGCILIGEMCDPKFGRLDVEQDETSIIARSREPQVMLTYMTARQQFVLIIGDETLYSRRDDCHPIPASSGMP